jgi:hypothetical protein
VARKAEQLAAIEAERLEILHGAQKEMRKRLTKELKVKKASPHLPGEEQHKKHLAVFLKIAVPGISYGEIGARLGETKTEVKGWFKDDPSVKDFYEWALSSFKSSGLEYLGTYVLEAIETQVTLMRYGSEKYMHEAAKDILDRYGLAKVSKSEVDSKRTQSHEWSDHDALASEIRQLPPELQEEAISVIEHLEDLLAKSGSTNGDSSEELRPIIASDEDDDDDEENEEEEN